MMWSSLVAATALLVPWARAQFPPEPEGITMLRSQFDNNITISYKEVSAMPIARPKQLQI